MEKNKREYSSLQNAIRILNAFTIDEPELGITQLAERLGISKSAVHRLVTSMLNEGLMAKDVNTNLYRLGISILERGNVVTSTMKIYRDAMPVLQELVKLANESVLLGIFREDKVFFLCRIDSPRSINSLSMTGSQVPAHCTSSGQIFLAHQPRENVERIIGKGLKAYTEKTITHRERLFELLDRVRAQGYAVSAEEYHKGVISVAAPIMSARGKVLATVSIPGPAQRMTKDAIAKIVKLVTYSAMEIARRYEEKNE